MMFTRSKDNPKKPAPSPAPVRKESGAPSIISAGVEINGHINSPGEIQLDGTIDGDITCGAFSLGESGKVNGRITADSVTIRGCVDGEICGSKVRLEKTAQVTGDVTHQTLSIEGGARISGHFIHNDSPLDRSSAELEVQGKLAAASTGAERPAQKPEAVDASRQAAQRSGAKPEDMPRREAPRQQEQAQAQTQNQNQAQGGRTKASA